jgi:ribosomal protein S18 acetylase RimI-like enzyme
MLPADVDRVVDIHLASFLQSFLSFLGPRFLREFYRATLEDESGLAFVAVNDAGNRVGFVAGQLRPHQFYRRLLVRRCWAFALASAVPALRRPSIIPRLLRALTYRGNTPRQSGGALLASLAVDPASQGKGAAKLLVRSFLAECRRRGASYACLTTDREGNKAVNNLYQRLGWKLDQQFVTPEGRWMSRYIHDLSDTDIPSDGPERTGLPTAAR